ncbi:MAG: hypothetical protein JJT78_13715, partial [Leptospira sp.]|nr:hypothetical protein [Leptospira sp.]
MERSKRNIFAILLFCSFFSQCIPFKVNDLDPNSSFGQLLNLLRIQSALQPREIRISGSVRNNISGGEPYYGLLIQTRKMDLDYFTDYADGFSETQEGIFAGTFPTDVNGDFELVLESGLGKYKIDYTEETPDGLEIIYSELIDVQRYNQSTQNLVISKS